MKIKKNSWILMAIVVMSLGLFSSCGQEKAAQNDKFTVVTTIFPPYDFVREIAGDQVNVSMLLPPGAESHSYEPTPQDIIAIQECDLFIYVGGESDAWVADILDSMGEDAPDTLTLMDCVQVVAEETVEGMEEEAEETDSEEGSVEEVEYDEHVWTSPKNAILIVEKIANELSLLDDSNSEAYQSASTDYIEKLKVLDSSFETVVSSATRNMMIFGDRFPFRYFADAYGLDYYAAFPGCSSETEPSAATVAFLTDKVSEEKLPVVFYIEFSNHKVADAIAEATGAKAMLFHSCHNVSAEELEAGATYLSLMENNVEVLKEALN